jgi:hypothetical protein
MPKPHKNAGISNSEYTKTYPSASQKPDTTKEHNRTNLSLEQNKLLRTPTQKIRTPDFHVQMDKTKQTT